MRRIDSTPRRFSFFLRRSLTVFTHENAPQERRIERLTLGGKVPAPLVGLRCIAPPAREEIDTAFEALAVLKRATKKVRLPQTNFEKKVRSKTKHVKTHNASKIEILRNTSQPALKIAGTLARPTVTGEALVSASVKPTPQQQEPAGGTVVASAPLLVFEDRGALAPAADAPQAQAIAPQAVSAPAETPHAAEQRAAPNGISAPVPPELARDAVAPAATLAGGLPPLSRLHEEVAAFAAAAWPTRVR